MLSLLLRACRRMAFATTAAAITLVLTAPLASAECKLPDGKLQSSIGTLKENCTHALCGAVFDARGATSSKPAGDRPFSCQSAALNSAMTGAIANGGVVILGETHDSAIHHRLQGAAVADLSRNAPRLKGVVFEQFRADQQAGIDQFHEFDRTAARLGTINDLKKMTDWEKSGWAKYDYDPLLKEVVAARIPIFAGDVPRAEIMAAAKKGPEALKPDEAKRLALDVPLGAAADAASIDEIEASHCGAMPKSAFGGMAFAQRYRDAHLADVTLRAMGADGSAILIAGTGHARSDRAVPWYIRQRAPDKPIVSVMFVEVEDGKTDPAAYLQRDPDGKPAADFLVFTARTEREDPCAKMRSR
ncbi:hypothetical protein DLM45_01125 [Hyphomicrobium methylovorum]|nr:hypothetical protein [Hyphomicrobium methylovorum]